MLQHAQRLASKGNIAELAYTYSSQRKCPLSLSSFRREETEKHKLFDLRGRIRRYLLLFFLEKYRIYFLMGLETGSGIFCSSDLTRELLILPPFPQFSSVSPPLIFLPSKLLVARLETFSTDFFNEKFPL